MGVGRERRTGECIGEIVKCWYRMTCLDPEQPGGKKNSMTNGRRIIMNARSWTMELTERGAEEYRITICVKKATTVQRKRNNKDSERHV